MLKARELIDIMEIGRTAMGCDEVDELRKAVVKAVVRVFAVERANFFLIRSYPSPRPDLDHIVVEGIDQEYVDLYRQRYNQMDPFLKTFFTSTQAVTAQVVTTGHVISARDLGRSEYYNDFLRPQSIHYQLVIYLWSSGQLLGTLGLCRAKDEKNFSPTDFAKAELLGSYLAGALQKAIFMGKVAKSSEIINSICPDLPYKGLIVLDESLEPVYINEDARKTISSLTEEKELREDSLFPLPGELYTQCKLLTEYSARQKEDTAANREAKILNKSTGQTISTNLRLINHSRDSGLYLICMNQNEGTLLSKHLKKFGLTGRELEVSKLVCEGFKNSEIGEKLFISEYTVENHLRSIYEKLEVKNRTSMAHKVMHFTSQG